MQRRRRHVPSPSTGMVDQFPQRNRVDAAVSCLPGHAAAVMPNIGKICRFKNKRLWGNGSECWYAAIAAAVKSLLKLASRPFRSAIN
jgi:hypothetical protein